MRSPVLATLLTWIGPCLPGNSGTGLALPAYQTRQYLPGFNDAAWLEQANGHGIGLNHVAILRDGDITPVSEPDVLVYRDMVRTGNMTANLTAHSRVKVYEGEKALLYRVFVQQPALRCLDIVVPAKGDSMPSSATSTTSATGRFSLLPTRPNVCRRNKQCRNPWPDSSVSIASSFSVSPRPL